MLLRDSDVLFKCAQGLTDFFLRQLRKERDQLLIVVSLAPRFSFVKK